MYMYFPPFSLENKLFGIHQTSFLPVEALEFSELKTPLVYTFFPPKVRTVSVRKNGKSGKISKGWLCQGWLWVTWNVAAGRKNRGSLMSVPQALREVTRAMLPCSLSRISSQGLSSCKPKKKSMLWPPCSSFAGKAGAKTNRPKNSAPTFGRPKSVFQNSGPNSGSRGATSPPRKLSLTKCRMPNVAARFELRETTQDPEIEGSRSYQSSVTPLFRGTKTLDARERPLSATTEHFLSQLWAMPMPSPPSTQEKGRFESKFPILLTPWHETNTKKNRQEFYPVFAWVRMQA